MKIVRKISIILTILLMSLMFTPSIYAEEQETFSDIIQQADDWSEFGEASNTAVDTAEISNIFKPIAQALTTIGVGVLLCVSAVMGIKWVTAKPDEQAKLKQQSIGLLVAAIVILGAYTIWSIAVKIVGSL